MKFSIIIPCYNESKNLKRLLQKIVPLQRRYDLEYILVENGSGDNSKEFFKKYIEGKYQGIQTVYINENRGYGYGLQQGMKAAQGDYIGWIHADMQMAPEELVPFFQIACMNQSDRKLFIKGRRTGRSRLDRVFTLGQSLVNTVMFRTVLYDVGAIPVLFHRSLLHMVRIEKMPNDFSIELYIYLMAVKHHFKVIRKKVRLRNRKNGKSSWDHGVTSKIHQSERILKDSIKIKKGEKIL